MKWMKIPQYVNRLAIENGKNAALEKFMIYSILPEQLTRHLNCAV